MPGARLLLVFSLLGLLGSGCGGGGKSPSLLDELGVPHDDVPRVDAATVHPLGRPFATYLKKSELFLSGVVTQASAPFTGDFAAYAGKRQVLLDDRAAAPQHAPLFSAQDESWTVYRLASVAADSDGDGIEEVVVLYYASPDAYLRTIRRRDSGYEQSDAHALGTFSLPAYPELPAFDNLQLAAGDLDGDGRDELAAAIGDAVLVLDDETTGFQQLSSVSYRPGVSGQVTTVAIGNVDTDRDVELVVVNGRYASGVEARYYVYSLQGGALLLDDGDAVLAEAASLDGARSYRFARVAVGDLDGDNFNEVAFAGNVGNGQLSVTVMKHDPGAGALAALTTGRYAMHEQLGQHQYVPEAAVLNADGFENGRRKELLAYRYILQLGTDGELRHRFGGDGDGAPLPLPYYDKVTVGDFDGDLRDEVALYEGVQLVTTIYPRVYASVFGYQEGTFQELGRIPAVPGAHETTLCAVNTDADSLVLRYTGEYELLYTQPEVIAVLASPPYYQGQDTSSASTSIAWARGTETDTSKAYGFYVGMSIGYAWEVPLVYEAKVTVEIDATYDWTFTTVRSNAQSKSLSCPAGEDQVVFAVTPHDVYYYEVIGSPLPEQVGSRYAIELPRRPRIYPMELGRYNQIVGEDSRVPAEVLRHQLGDPWSYPTRSDMVALFTTGSVVKYDAASGRTYRNVVPISTTEAGFCTPDEFMLDIGGGAGGSQTIELSGGTSEGFGNDFDLKVGVAGEVKTAGGLFVAGRAGFHYGYSRMFSTSEETTITGTVPNLPVSMSQKKPYSVGLFSYPYPDTENPRYVVVDYWVEE